ncbi:MAG: hypothetical protein A3E80_00905 [Chlamydiae bacterium RIFCSPHIGHO2_12_FULL_49_9]|nr:MAG: hypothetical protein A3E80_00905 [Chlamydiae bacterium RIFCSPHIGHO2_12_FULL_49_9]
MSSPIESTIESTWEYKKLQEEVPPLPEGTVDFTYDSDTTVGDLQTRMKQQFPSKYKYIDIGIVWRTGRCCWEKRSMTLLTREQTVKVEPFFKKAWYCVVFDAEWRSNPSL